MNRRRFLQSALAAPFIASTSGLLMPVKAPPVETVKRPKLIRFHEAIKDGCFTFDRFDQSGPYLYHRGRYICRADGADLPKVIAYRASLANA